MKILVPVWAYVSAVEDAQKVRSMNTQGDLVVTVVTALLIAGIVWFVYLYARKQKLQRRDQNLKTYILKDPKMRDLYLQSRKESSKGSEK